MTIRDNHEVQEAGAISTKNLDIVFLESVLSQLVTKTDPLTSSEIEICLQKAIRAFIRSTAQDLEEFERFLEEEMFRRQSLPKARYTLYSRCYFTLKPQQKIRVRVGAYEGYFADGLSSLVDITEPLDARLSDQCFGPAAGAVFVSTVFARSEDAALDVANYQVDVLFGAMSYALHLGRKAILSEVNRPLAIAFPGSEIGLIGCNGRLCEGRLVFVATPSQIFHTDKDIPSRWDIVQQKILSGHPSKIGYYAEFFALYFQCLADPDSSNRFVKLWRVVEHLCHGAKEDDVVGIISAPFRDADLVRLSFYALQARRNRIVHSSPYGHHVEQAFEVARDLVERFVIRSASPQFPELEDWKSFLKVASGPIDGKRLKAFAELMIERDG